MRHPLPCPQAPLPTQRRLLPLLLPVILLRRLSLLDLPRRRKTHSMPSHLTGHHSGHAPPLPMGSWFRVYAPARRNPAVPGGPSPVRARTPTGTQRLIARAVRGPHWPLPFLSSAWAVSRIEHHQEAAPGKCGILAALVSSSYFCGLITCLRCAVLRHRRRGCSLLHSSRSCSIGPLGRLATLPDPAAMDTPPADTDRSDHLSRHGTARSRKSTFPPLPTSDHPSSACPLAALMGRAPRSQCSSSNCPTP